MKTVRNILIILSGLSIAVVSGFAYQLGLDPSPGLGRRRVLFLAAGVLVMLFPAYSAKAEDFARSLYQKYTVFRENLYDRLHVPDHLRHGPTQMARKQLAYGSAILACVAAMTVQTWFASAGTWNTWSTYSYYYDELANAFLHGQTWLEIPVNPLLLELPNPYDPEARGDIKFLFDATLYQGKYYLYWGPMPAVVLMAVKLIHPVAVGDNLIVFTGVALTTIFQTLLLTLLWIKYFQRMPVWTLVMGILIAGFVVPFNWMNNRPEVYEAAIINAQAFLLGGIYFALLAVRPRSISSRLLAVAAVLWACAVASRTIVVFEVIFASSLIFLLILGRPGSRTWKSKLTLVLGLPLIICAASLGAYNFIRFGSPLDFGVDYQLALFDQKEHKDEFFSSRYILPNIEIYTLTPPERVSTFPYMRAKLGDEIVLDSEEPDFYYKELVTGMVYVFPFVVFALVPIFRTIVKRIGRNLNDEEKMLQWTCVLLTGMALIAITYILTFFFATMRYYADLTPILSVLAVMGFWFGYRAVSSDWALRFAYSGVGILLASVSIIIPNLIALLVSQRINTYRPQVLPAIDIFFKVLFPG